jgi:hypothetical protein
MLRPTDIESLVNIYLEALDNSGAENTISPAMNALLLKTKDRPIAGKIINPRISLGIRRK